MPLPDVMESAPDWSDLLTEMLFTIARSLPVMEDFTAFRGVCTSWRAAAPKDTFVSVSKVPLLMLAEKDGTDEREFYSLAKRKICTRIPLPQLMGKRCYGVGFGWILTKSSDAELCLVKPFSSATIQPCNFREFPDHRKYNIKSEDLYIHQAWLTHDLSETSELSLLVDGNSCLGFWKNRDESWTKIEAPGGILTYWKGKIYVLDLQGNILVWDSQDYFSQSSKLVVPLRYGPTILTCWQDYLVGSSDGDQLLLIRRKNHYEFGVFKVDLEQHELEIGNLGNDAVFLGENAPVAVDATVPGILKPNCIYLTDNCDEAYRPLTSRKGGGKDMGIYNVADGSIQRFDVELLRLALVCPPMWIFPSFCGLS